MLVAACLWYLALTSVLMVGQYFLERHFAGAARRDAHRARAPASRRQRASGRAADEHADAATARRGTGAP